MQEMLEPFITVKELRKLRQAGRLVLVKEWSAIRLEALVAKIRFTIFLIRLDKNSNNYCNFLEYDLEKILIS